MLGIKHFDAGVFSRSADAISVSIAEDWRSSAAARSIMPTCLEANPSGRQARCHIYFNHLYDKVGGRIESTGLRLLRLRLKMRMYCAWSIIMCSLASGTSDARLTSYDGS